MYVESTPVVVNERGSPKVNYALPFPDCPVLSPPHTSTRFPEVQPYWLARLFISLSVLVTTLLLILGEGVLYGVEKFHHNGMYGVWALMWVAILSLFDITINDFMPRGFRFRWAKRYRHVVFMMLSLGIFSLVFVALRENGPSLSQALLSFQGVGAAFVAVLDLFSRHREKS